jgi:hypothetical protein
VNFINKGRNRMDFSSVTDFVPKENVASFAESYTIITFLK